jgi:hypothetical protein
VVQESTRGLGQPTKTSGLRHLYANVLNAVNLFADTFCFTLRVGTAIVPAVFGRVCLREARPTRIAEELAVGTVVLMEFEFEF